MQKKTVNTNLHYANFVKLTICSHCNAKANNMHSYLFKSLLGKIIKLLLSDGAAYRGEGGAECVHWGEVIIWVKARNACGPERKVIYKDACP